MTEKGEKTLEFRSVIGKHIPPYLKTIQALNPGNTFEWGTRPLCGGGQTSE